MTREPRKSGIGFLLASLALQNLGRRKARTLLLLTAVAICSGAVFTGAVLMQSIESSMSVGFTRLGADMLVVPAGTLTNITAALLTAEPTDLTLDDRMLSGLERSRACKGRRRNLSSAPTPRAIKDAAKSSISSPSILRATSPSSHGWHNISTGRCARAT